MHLVRCKLGDRIRLYGYPGTFTVHQYTGTRAGMFVAVCDQDDRVRWPANEATVVEVNGEPLPSLSAPIAPPAADYPHLPRFAYDDGPQELGREVLRRWLEEKAQKADRSSCR